MKKIMTENILNMERGKTMQVHEAQKVLIKIPIVAYTKAHQN